METFNERFVLEHKMRIYVDEHTAYNIVYEKEIGLLKFWTTNYNSYNYNYVVPINRLYSLQEVLEGRGDNVFIQAAEDEHSILMLELGFIQIMIASHESGDFREVD